MRFIYLILTLALIWFVVETYMDHAFHSAPVTGTVDATGIVADGAEGNASEPFFNREMEKARGVGDQLQRDVDRRLEETDKNWQ